uniref:Glutathione peroxidase n=1 Tax=Florenciella parvula TaxID=236787 RepID=A0A7S2F903_9STRA|mmetsp:Transcript_10110/g.21317  ORF Transcript_10110/g.21317 Transcript_10110/m.21317 type:complete len:113 (+) Transcript_10110:176-514(+)
MNELYASFNQEGAGLEIVVFPCNQFGGQEPGSPADIKSKLDKLGVSFPVAAKTDVKGANQHPVYGYLQNLPGYVQPGWNFGVYFLFDGEGELVKVHKGAPGALEEDIEELLA